MKKLTHLAIPLAILLLVSGSLAAAQKVKGKGRSFVTELKTWNGPIPKYSKPVVTDIKSSLQVGSEVILVTGYELEMEQANGTKGDLVSIPSIRTELWTYSAHKTLRNLAKQDIQRILADSKLDPDQKNAAIERIKVQVKTQSLEKRMEILSATTASPEKLQDTRIALDGQRFLLNARQPANSQK